VPSVEELITLPRVLKAIGCSLLCKGLARKLAILITARAATIPMRRTLRDFGQGWARFANCERGGGRSATGGFRLGSVLSRIRGTATGERLPFRRPLPFQEQLLGAIPIEEFVERRVAKYDEDRVVIVTPMFGRPRPFLWREFRSAKMSNGNSC
jgi:hypothetical protein